MKQFELFRTYSVKKEMINLQDFRKKTKKIKNTNVCMLTYPPYYIYIYLPLFIDDSTLIVTWEPPVGQYDGSISRYTRKYYL